MRENIFGNEWEHKCDNIGGNAYERNPILQECFENSSWYGFEDDSEYSRDLTYNPDEEAMETIAALKPELFAYDRPFLMSRDRKILYGFIVTEEEVLELPESVIVYDNFFIHEEGRGYKKVIINVKLESIVNRENAFGFFVEEYKVVCGNPYFCTYQGMLLDELPEDYAESHLIFFPSGRFRRNPDEYIQFPKHCFLVVDSYAIYTEAFVKMMVLPPATELMEKSIWIQSRQDGECQMDSYNKNKQVGMLVANVEVQNRLDDMVRQGMIGGVSIEYYN